MTSGSATDLRAWLADQFVSSVNLTAANLRDLADTIEARAAQIRRVSSLGLASAGIVAARIVNDVTGGLANAGLGGIVSAAARYDNETS